ncbi:MAG TPA: polysaccharide deacetylase family protein [Tepidisphaeraceae bacterium]|jgi:peptidoglycan/xylan/chitin deacetylase (PgdA/CDA1 family)|nr:polysaccharide deacetylase family protein [Tepidisphaeraceae bacterium]
MQPKSYITTSWDDGNILDFRIAQMLAKHGLRGTFYIPREASTGVMSEAHVRELSQSFEIGAHTMRHVFLDTADDNVAQREIHDSKSWVENVTGKPSPMFCPPGGKFNAAHLGFIKSSGFAALRSVELLSIDAPRTKNGLVLIPTTLQAHPHGLAVYARNIAKRQAWRNLWMYVRHGHAVQWEKLAHNLLEAVRRQGGVFHLWGHSWEIEQAGQWERLENVLAFLGAVAKEIPCLTNGELCAASDQKLSPAPVAARSQSAA